MKPRSDIGKPREHYTRKLVIDFNEQIECACGCGKMIYKYGYCGKPTRFAMGHGNFKQNEARKIWREKLRKMLEDDTK